MDQENRKVKSNVKSRRSKRGVSLIEAALGALILIPIALATVDLIAIVIANSMNDTAVKNCARAGANQPNVQSAGQAADKVLATLNKGVYSIQQKVNKKLFMRPIPKIRFVADKKIKEAARVEELLEKIKETGIKE